MSCVYRKCEKIYVNLIVKVLSTNAQTLRTTNNTFQQYSMKKLYLAIIACIAGFAANAQVVFFTPNFSGGFENGGTFAANQWTVVNGPNNQWAVGTGSVNIGTRGAYIGNATTFAGTDNAAINHFYRTANINIPTGATSAVLAFRYLQPVVDPGGDSFYVSIGLSTAPIPTAGNIPDPTQYTKIYANTATAFTNYTEISIDMSAYIGLGNHRLVITHVNNGSGNRGIPAVDSFSFSYCAEIGSTTTSICQGATTTFTCPNNAAGAWSSSNTAIATATTGGTTSTISGVSAGTATITNVGGTCTVTKVITINPNPTPLAATNICATNTVTLTSTPAGGTWVTAAPGVATISSGGVVTGIAAGTTAVTYTLPTTCRTISAITVNANPIVYTVSGGGSYCASGSGLPVNLSSSNTGINYLLYNGATLVTTRPGTGSAITYPSITPAGTYTVLAVNPVTGCSSAMSGSATISVDPPVTPSVSITSPATTFCTGTPATFNATPVNGGLTPTYQWYVNGIATGTGTSYSFTPSSGDVVSVTLYPGGICTLPDTATDDVTLTVLPLTTPSVSISSAPASPLCAGTTVTMSATSVNGGSAPSYRWNKNGINVATGSTYSYAPNDGDNIYCVLTSNYVCRSSDTAVSSTITLNTVASASLPVVNIIASPGTTVPAGTTVTLLAAVTASAPVSYQWILNGSAIGGATTASYTSNTFANGDIVTCQVTNMDICNRFTLKSVVISNSTTGLSTTSTEPKVIIAPNPASSYINVIAANISTNSIQAIFTDVAGKVVKTVIVNSNNGTVQDRIDITDINAGFYLVTLSADGAKWTTKLTKE